MPDAGSRAEKTRALRELIEAARHEGTERGPSGWSLGDLMSERPEWADALLHSGVMLSLMRNRRGNRH